MVRRPMDKQGLPNDYALLLCTKFKTDNFDLKLKPVKILKLPKVKMSAAAKNRDPCDYRGT